ncbi:hypothetical protein RM151_08030 [Pantoea agglomerans]|uniref:hypothetical protein n=1 Tax=Enterobacter agglomerans TaxID=549 RepID=UPI002898E2AE|nr:hypothetical protein [Pantoea agglomerans]WNK59553.1 hypothetical protein RM151_08030 [Pantoea agglomerans]
MSDKEFTPEESASSLKETDDLKDELAKARAEIEAVNQEVREDLTNEIKKMKSKESKLIRDKMESELNALRQLQELELKRKKDNLRRAQRMRILMRLNHVILFAPLISGVLILLLPLKPFYDLFSINDSYANIAAVSLMLISIFSLMLKYLQTGFKKNSDNELHYAAETLIDSSDTNNKNESRTKEISNTLRLISSFKRETESEVAKLRGELAILKHAYANQSSDREILSADNKNEIVDTLKAKLLSETSQLTALEILNSINEKVSQNDKSGQIDNVFNKTLERLKSETASLGRRGNLNLSLGIITTIIGLSLLGFFVVDTKIIPEDKLTFITGFIPRLSLVILIEVFAYFFLKLYKATLAEIKYFQNEMTNIEAKYAAIQCAKFTDDKVAFSSAIAALTSTERNALLEKGQTTADIEMAKIENKNISVISEKVMKFIKNKNDEQ